MSARQRALRATLGLSYRLRAPALWDLVRRGRTKILMYHGITRRDRYEGVTNHFGFNLPARQFEAHVTYLARRCNVISLQDFLDGRVSRSRTNVVLTFDDGYENNYTCAFPVLQRLGLPALFALPTAFVGDRVPLWNDVVEYAVNRSSQARVTMGSNGTRREFELAERWGRVQLLGFLLHECVRSDMKHRADTVEAAVAELAVERDPGAILSEEDYRPLAAEQMREMLRSGLIEFASHSVTHPMLAALEPEELRHELRASKQAVSELTGVPCRAICLPGGSYDASVVDEAASAGYECVLSSDQGVARRGERVLRRFGVFHHHDLARFADLVHGPVQEMLAAVRRVKRAVMAALRPGMSR